MDSFIHRFSSSKWPMIMQAQRSTTNRLIETTEAWSWVDNVLSDSGKIELASMAISVLRRQSTTEIKISQLQKSPLFFLISFSRLLWSVWLLRKWEKTNFRTVTHSTLWLSTTKKDQNGKRNYLLKDPNAKTTHLLFATDVSVFEILRVEISFFFPHRFFSIFSSAKQKRDIKIQEILQRIRQLELKCRSSALS